MIKQDGKQFSESGKAIQKINVIIDTEWLDVDCDNLYPAVLAEIDSADEVTKELVLAIIEDMGCAS